MIGWGRRGAYALGLEGKSSRSFHPDSAKEKMNTLLFVKGLVGLIVFLAAIGALLMQLQTRKVFPPILKVKGPRLLTWHRWLGRTALAGMVFNGALCLLIGLYPALRSDPRHLAHSILAILLAIAFLSKVWVTRRKIRWGIKQILP